MNKARRTSAPDVGLDTSPARPNSHVPTLTEPMLHHPILSPNHLWMTVLRKKRVCCVFSRVALKRNINCLIVQVSTLQPPLLPTLQKGPKLMHAPCVDVLTEYRCQRVKISVRQAFLLPVDVFRQGLGLLFFPETSVSLRVLEEIVPC